MVYPKARLLISAGLFVSWIGFLVYLVAQSREAVILSRPQFLVASAYVVAELKGDAKPRSEVRIKEVTWTKDADDLSGKTLVIEDLPDCGHLQGWAGAGDYVLALTKEKARVYHITPLPLTPGFMPAFKAVELDHAGTNPDQVAPIIKEFTGADDGRVQEWLQRPGATLRRNVTKTKAESFREQMQNLGASVVLRDFETRIYPATSAARRQLTELIAEWK
jgi:hypothetical protein